MFHLAYPSCKGIGAVLLQTAPARGLSAGRMESFLRAMREVRYTTFILFLSWSADRARLLLRSNGIRKSYTSHHRMSGSSRPR